MAAVTDDKIKEVAEKLWLEMYEASFRGKDRGRFCLTREQLRQALDTERLHPTTIQRLQDEALGRGLVIIDLDDLFPCIEVNVVRKYRRPTHEVFVSIFPQDDEDDPDDGDEE